MRTGRDGQIRKAGKTGHIGETGETAVGSGKGTDGRYTIGGDQHRGNDSHPRPVRLRGKGIATAMLYNIFNCCAAFTWVGLSGSADEAPIG